MGSPAAIGSQAGASGVAHSLEGLRGCALVSAVGSGGVCARRAAAIFGRARRNKRCPSADCGGPVISNLDFGRFALAAFDSQGAIPDFHFKIFFRAKQCFRFASSFRG